MRVAAMIWDHHAQVITASASAISGLVAVGSRDAWFLEWFGVPLPVLLAAFAGAACSLSFLPVMGIARALITLTVSMLFSAYIMPIAVWYGSIPDKLALGLAFGIALCAQTIVGTVLNMTPHTIKQIADAVIERIRGGKGRS